MSGRQNPPPAIPGPWYCVLDNEWKLLYLGVDELAANAAATASPGAQIGKARRMGDAQSVAVREVAAARRRTAAA